MEVTIKIQLIINGKFYATGPRWVKIYGLNVVQGLITSPKFKHILRMCAVIIGPQSVYKMTHIDYAFILLLE